jgi:hypothetical protein
MSSSAWLVSEAAGGARRCRYPGAHASEQIDALLHAASLRIEDQRLVTGQDRDLVAVTLSGPRRPRPHSGSGAVPATVISALRRAAKGEQAYMATQPMSSAPEEASHAPTPNRGEGRAAGTGL